MRTIKILIDVNTIRKNPDYTGPSGGYKPGPMAANFEARGQIPSNLIEGIDYAVTARTLINGVWLTEGEILSREALQKLEAGPLPRGFGININAGTIPYIDNREYLYHYKLKDIYCDKCKQAAPVNKWLDNWQYLEDFYLCPNCYQWQDLIIDFEQLPEALNRMQK